MTETALVERTDAQSYDIRPAAPSTSSDLLGMIDRAIERGVAVETLDKLLALQERWEANRGRKAFDAAVAEAKAEIPTIRKNRTVEFTTQKGRTTYRHEDMAEIARTVDPILGKHGLSYRFRTNQEGKAVIVTCILAHRDGYSEETTLSTTADESGNKNHIQGVGSAVTYLQRYTLKAALGLAAAQDDDGRAANTATQAAPPSPMSAEDYQRLRQRIEAQGEDAEKVEDFLLGKFGVEALADLDKAQHARAMTALAQREQAKKGAA